MKHLLKIICFLALLLAYIGLSAAEEQAILSTEPVTKATEALPAPIPTAVQASSSEVLQTPDDTIAIESSGGFNNSVSALLIEPNGTVMVGGNFTSYGGVQVGRGIARLDSRGNLNKTFTNNTRLTFQKAEVYGLARQPDGRILAAGNFLLHGVAHQVWQSFARFSAEGILDRSFAHILDNGFDGAVVVIAVQPDGKILVGGNFQGYGGTKLGGIARLMPDGSLDHSFLTNLGGGVDEKSTIKAIVIQPDGRIVLAGDFSGFSGRKLDGIVRLMPDGSPDQEFIKTVGASFFVGFPLLEAEDSEDEAGLYLSKALLQPSGQIILGGEFISYDTNQDIYSSRVLRIDSAGNLDLDFIKKTLKHKFETDVNALLLMPDEKIVVGCSNPFSRLNSDGSHDEDFLNLAGRAIGGDINVLALQPDGKIIVGGRFNSYKGIKVGNIVRLNPDGTMDERFISGSYK